MSEILNICTEIAEKISNLNVGDGYQQGFDDGKKAEHDKFWDEATTSTSYIGRFAGRSWTENNFRPTKDLNITSNCNYCFYNHGSGADLISLAEELGITITIKPSTASSMFEFSNLKRIAADFSECTALNNTFSTCTQLETLNVKLREDSTTTYSATFLGCKKLKNFVVESGFIGKNIDFQYSPLTKESIESIMNARSETATFTIIFSKAAVDTAFETSEGAADGSESAEWIALDDERQNVTTSLV